MVVNKLHRRSKMKMFKQMIGQFSLLIVGILTVVNTATADQVILDDLIVDGSACIGFDCVNGESFGFDTIRIKENNLRIRAQDTSSTASFPTNDWQITFNDSANGGANKFSIDDIDGGRTPFTIEAGAPSHSLFVDDGGRLGLGTSIPVTDIHVKSGNTPTLRLEQDGSSGFTPQTWDVAGNEAGFFIRDATNGSTLPFRIIPGASSSALVIAANSSIGVGTLSPDAVFHIQRGGSGGAGLPRILMDNTDYTNPNGADGDWFMDVNDNGLFRISLDGSGSQELEISPTGDLTILGDINSTGTTVVPDYVFESDYKLRTLDELSAFIEKEKHLPNVPSAAEVLENGLNMSKLQMTLLEKIEELTLYTLAQEKAIRELREKLEGIAK